MKKLLCFLFLTTLFLTTLFAEQKHFKVSYDPDYAPFSYVQNNKPHGLLIDFWLLWAKKNNYTVEFINGKLWDNAIDLVKTKKVDFFLGTEVYEDWMYGSDEFYKAKTSLFKLTSNKNNMKQKDNLKIGLIGKDYEESIKENFSNSTTLIYEDYDSIFKDLINKKIDLIYDDKLAIKFYILSKRIFHLIDQVDILTLESPIQAISHSQNLIKIFNKGFHKVSKTHLLEIEKKWIITDNLLYEENKILKKFYLTNDEKDFISNKTFNVSVSKSWKPFTFSSQGVPSGIATDFWNLISKKTNIKSDFHFYSDFTNQLEKIKNKEEDLTYSTGKTKDREKYALFTEPYLTLPISIATLKDENFIEDGSKLAGKKIAVGRNYTAYKLFKEKYPNMDFLVVKNIQEGLKKVNNEEAYAYIDIKPNLTYNINKLGYKNLKVSGNTGLDFELRIMVRDDYPLLVATLNKIINTITTQQKEAIMAKWSNIQFEDKFNYDLLIKILAIVILIVLAIIYRYIVIQRANNSLKRTIDERTKELQILNENLEKLVIEKTKELTETNEILDEAQKIAHLGSYKYNIKENSLLWSDEHYRIFGLEPSSKKPTFGFFISCVDTKDKQKVLDHLDYAKSTNKTLRFEYKINLENGTSKFVESTSRIKYNKDEEPAFIIGTILDITSLKTLEYEKRQQENLLAQQSKMAAMGEMLENIAHQWRQPLSLISTASSSIKLHKDMNMLKDEFLYRYLEKISNSSQYLSKTIDDFRNFFKTNKNIIEFDLEDMIEKCLVILSSKIDNREIDIIIDSKESIVIKSLESELIQVIMNLIKNGIDVIENRKDKKLIFINIYEKNNMAIIKIKDNGGGIDESIINRIFEPYFTTKHKSQGTGIGLYMSLEIITKHTHGDMKVENSTYTYEDKEYKGAEFTIYLPKDITKL